MKVINELDGVHGNPNLDLLRFFRIGGCVCIKTRHFSMMIMARPAS